MTKIMVTKDINVEVIRPMVKITPLLAVIRALLKVSSSKTYHQTLSLTTVFVKYFKRKMKMTTYLSNYLGLTRCYRL